VLTFRLHLKFTPPMSGEATSTLRSLVGPVRAEPGCRSTRLSKDTGDGCEFTWVSEWREAEDFERHIRGSAFRQIVAVIEMAEELPTIEIDDLSSRRGFDLIEEILGRAPSESPSLENG
jgi:quinol monooxygenase YgiN